jgi:hypothetical protein
MGGCVLSHEAVLEGLLDRFAMGDAGHASTH